jgi:methionyl aminopeptidase
VPDIFHFKNDFPCDVMRPGHTFTIEPMLCLGSASIMEWDDGWTITTVDGKPSAQFEHTLLIGEHGAEILTKKLPDSPKFFWDCLQ